MSSGALGGSAVALFFLIVDAIDGRPLFTPSLMGSVLFEGAAAEAVSAVRLDAIALFSVAHMAVFLALGSAFTLLVYEVELHAKHPLVVLAVIVAIIEVAFFTVAPLALSGVIEQLGLFRVGFANLLAAGAMAVPFVIFRREHVWHKFKLTPGDLIFDSVYSGAIGGSAAALYFLFLDVLEGQPFFTPSVMGSVIFLGVTADAVTSVRLDAVAYFTMLHMFTFVGVGAAITVLVHEVELHSKHPIIVLLVAFAIIEATFFFVGSLILPGVIVELGVLPIAGANLLAAGSMTAFFVWSHRAGRRAAEELMEVAD